MPGRRSSRRASAERRPPPARLQTYAWYSLVRARAVPWLSSSGDLAALPPNRYSAAQICLSVKLLHRRSAVFPELWESLTSPVAGVVMERLEHLLRMIRRHCRRGGLRVRTI